jgi:hypothetical protein
MHHTIKMRSEGVSPCIPNPGSGWRWVVISMSRLLYPQGISTVFLTQTYVILKCSGISFMGFKVAVLWALLHP